MARRDVAVAILAVMVAVMVVGEVTVYYLNPYSFNSDVYESEDGIEYMVESSGSSEFRIVELDPGSMEPIERFYVYFDSNYGYVGLFDADSSIDELVLSLSIHGVEAIVVDADALRSVVENEEPCGSCIIFITGAMPSTVYEGTSDDPILNWTASGGTLYWMGETLGKYVGNGDGSIREVEGWWDLFYGEGCFNESDESVIGDTRGDSLGDTICLRSSNVQFGMSLSVPNSKHIGYVSDSGYGSVGLAKYGSGMLCIIGGYFDDDTRSDLVQVVSSNVTYDSVVILDQVVNVKGGSKTGPLEDSPGAVVYIFCGGYFSPYGARYTL